MLNPCQFLELGDMFQNILYNQTNPLLTQSVLELLFLDISVIRDIIDLQQQGIKCLLTDAIQNLRRQQKLLNSQSARHKKRCGCSLESASTIKFRFYCLLLELSLSLSCLRRIVNRSRARRKLKQCRLLRITLQMHQH